MSHTAVHVQRRRWILWGPLAAAGLGILVWQVSSWTCNPVWVLVGILLCLPWIGDVSE